MFRNTLFRERALIRSAQPEPIDDLLRVTAPHEWLLLACLAAASAGCQDGCGQGDPYSL